MGLGDTASTVLMTFKADTSDARKNIKALKDEERRLAENSLRASEARNRALESSVAIWGKVAVGIGAAVAAYKTITASVQAFAKESQLRHAAAGLNITRIKDAAHGLLTEYEALSFAAAQQNTDFRLNQMEMEQVAKFMVVLRNKGKDLTAVYQGVTKALVEGNAEGLRQFGISINETSDRAKAHAEIMRRITEENAKAGDTIELAGDKSLAAANAMKDAFHEVKIALGELMDALAPVVMGFSALLSSAIPRRDNIGVLAPFESAIARRNQDILEQQRRIDEIWANADDRLQTMATASNVKNIAAAVQHAWKPSDETRKLFASVLSPLEDLSETLMHSGVKKGVKRGIKEGVKFDEDYRWMTELGEELFKGLAIAQHTILQKRVELQNEQRAAMNPRGWEASGLLGGQTMGAGQDTFAAGEQITSTFDRLVQSSQMVRDALLMTQDAFHVFANAAGEAFGAFITGSESASAAFKKMFASSILGMAKDLAAKAIYHGVSALGYVALGLMGQPGAFAAAAVAGKAAAMAASGALVLGGMASALGAGAGAGASSHGSASGMASTLGAGYGVGAAMAGGGGGQVGRDVTIFVGSDFGDNPRANAQRLRRALDRTRQQQGDNIVSFE